MGLPQVLERRSLQAESPGTRDFEEDNLFVGASRAFILQGRDDGRLAALAMASEMPRKVRRTMTRCAFGEGGACRQENRRVSIFRFRGAQCSSRRSVLPSLVVTRQHDRSAPGCLPPAYPRNRPETSGLGKSLKKWAPGRIRRSDPQFRRALHRPCFARPPILIPKPCAMVTLGSLGHEAMTAGVC